MIWPELDAWKGCFGPQPHQKNDLAAMGVTNLLFYLREVVLQDSVVLRKMFPSNLVWNHPVFQHEAYKSFAQKVKASQQEEESPSQLSILYRAMPFLAEHLKAAEAQNEQRARKLEALLDSMAESQQAQSSQLQLLTSGGLTFRLEAPLAAVWPQGRPTHPSRPLMEAAPLALSTAGSSRYTSAQASAVSSPCRMASPPLSQPEPRPEPRPESGPPPVHRMCRAVKTVRALWREWTEGLGGNPSVAALDSKWGSRWRAGWQNEL